MSPQEPQPSLQHSHRTYTEPGPAPYSHVHAAEWRDGTDTVARQVAGRVLPEKARALLQQGARAVKGTVKGAAEWWRTRACQAGL